MARWFSVRSVAISFLFATILQHDVMTMRPRMYRPCALFSWSIHLDNVSLIVLWTMRPLDDSSLRICDPGRYVLTLDRIHGRWIITKDTFFSWALGMSVPDPGSRISDPRSKKTATKERDEKKFVVLPLFVATKITKIVNYINFELLKKRILGQFTNRTSTQKIVIKLSKIWIWDPGSEIRKKT